MTISMGAVPAVGAGSPGASGQPVCPAHPGILMVDYGGQPWCKFCESSRFRLVRILSTWLLASQWLLVISLPFSLAAACLLAPRELLEDGSLARSFWLWILPSTSFLAAMSSTVLGHGFLKQFTGMRIVSWFHPRIALKDWFLIGCGFTILYLVSLYGAGRVVPGVALPADTVESWLMTRLPVLLFASFLTLIVLDRTRLISSETLIPRVRGRIPATVFYSLLLAGCYLGIQSVVAALAASGIPTRWFALGVGSSLAALVLMITALGLIWLERPRLGTPRTGPMPVTLALVGPSAVGKTVFLTRAYHLLGRCAHDSISLTPSKESGVILGPHVQTIEQHRDWPPGTVSAADFILNLNIGFVPVVTFSWLELPGAAFTDPANYQAQASAFNRHLVNSDAVAMMVDGGDLVKAKQLGDVHYAHVYNSVTRDLYSRLATLGSAARPVPLAIIITKCCNLRPVDVLRCRQLVQPIADYWQSLAAQAGIRVPPVRIFMSSAIVTPQGRPKDIPRAPEPLRSVDCVEPLAWLAGQVMREGMTLLEVASGFFGSTRIQEAIVRVEALRS